MIVNLTKVLSPEGKKELRKGQVLGFEKNGVVEYYRITLADRRNDKFMAKKVTRYKMDDDTGSEPLITFD